MAAKPDKREIVVESDFLFGLREGDRHHPDVENILSMNKKGALEIAVLSSAVVEVRAVLYSKGFAPNQVEEAVTLMDFLLSEAGIRNFIEVKLSDVVLSESLRSQHSELGFFDSLHATVAKRVDLTLLSSDPIYKKIGLKTLNFEETR
jgi:predicted nucleic acid-binding protein